MGAGLSTDVIIALVVIAVVIVLVLLTVLVNRIVFVSFFFFYWIFRFVVFVENVINVQDGRERKRLRAMKQFENVKWLKIDENSTRFDNNTRLYASNYEWNTISMVPMRMQLLFLSFLFSSNSIYLYLYQ